MVAKRIIARLDCKEGRVVKGVQFAALREAGDLAALAEAYNQEGADELVMLAISASREGRATLVDTVHEVARRTLRKFFLHGRADAALAASIFHFRRHTLCNLKAYLASRGVAVRPFASGQPPA